MRVDKQARRVRDCEQSGMFALVILEVEWSGGMIRFKLCLWEWVTDMEERDGRDDEADSFSLYLARRVADPEADRKAVTLV